MYVQELYVFVAVSLQRRQSREKWGLEVLRFAFLTLFGSNKKGLWILQPWQASAVGGCRSSPPWLEIAIAYIR